MFDPQVHPRVFALPPGVDFADAFVQGLNSRLSDHPPEARGRVELVVNSARMRRRLQDVLQAGPAALHPRVRLVTDVLDPTLVLDLPPSQPALHRQLELSQLVARLLDVAPDLAPRSALFDLTESLTNLLDEMQTEGVPLAAVLGLEVPDQSGHWQRALRFLSILEPYLIAKDGPLSQPALQRLATQRLIARWRDQPPAHPVIVLGSTGSRGTTRLLIEAVARLPQGAIVLPGFDFDVPAAVWTGLSDSRAEDHPQYRFADLMQGLGMAPGDVMRWTDQPSPDPARAAVLSLALRPAPVTHQWLSEGPNLPDLPQAMAGVTLLETQTPREEAQAIALTLRAAVQEGRTAALITPDRMLTRQVTAALDRWGIRPDDSAGIPLQQTAGGRLMRHIAGLLTRPLTAEVLLTLLKHPLCHATGDRGQHLLNTRDLELYIRRTGLPFPDPADLIAWGLAEQRESWATWVSTCFFVPLDRDARPLSDWLTRQVDLALACVAGSEEASIEDEATPLWTGRGGSELREMVQSLKQAAELAGALSARDYVDLFTAVLARGEVRDSDTPHPNVLIWGTIEARVLGPDLLILAGLNEGSWPEMPQADPWLNRRMRAMAGLLAPERRVGLSAHDFQQACCGPQVILSRSLRSDDAETVPSRWLNRLMNLLNGLPMRDGPQALSQMRARGLARLAQVRALEEAPVVPPAPRPSPCPPLAARPRQLPVTGIRNLIRDPYAVYARYVLGLRPLDPLQAAPDARLRGIVVHKVLERFVRGSQADPDTLTEADFLTQAEAVLGDKVPWPVIRQVWRARMTRLAPLFVGDEKLRQARATPVAYEVEGKALLPAVDFTLTATADRIDLDVAGFAQLYDYKNTVPSAKQQAHFEKQLVLEAAILERAGIGDLPPTPVARAVYIGVGTNPVEAAVDLTAQSPSEAWAKLEQLILAYQAVDQGYTSRNAVFQERIVMDYDHLARFGEWDTSDTPLREALT